MDGRQRESHGERNERYYPNSVSFFDVRDKDGFDGFNCILPGQFLQGRIVAGSKAHYTGQAIELTTAAGSRLTITPNHPVLTDLGFIPAHRLKKSDNLVRYSGSNQPAVPSYNNQHVPAKVEQVFEAIGKAFPDSRYHKFVAPLNFHGEAVRFDGYVEIVRTDSQLGSDVKIPSAEFVNQNKFNKLSSPQSSLKGSGSLQASLKPVMTSTSGSMGSLDLSETLATVLAGPLQFLSLGSAANLDAGLDKPAGECLAADSALIRKLFERYPRSILFDQIVNINVIHYDGPVYDFESTLGWVVVGTTIIANCRCSTIPVYKDDWKELKANGADFSAFAEDAEGHDHGVDGKFVTKGGDGTSIKNKPFSSHPGAVVELHEKAEGVARKRLDQFKAQFSKITDVPVAKQVKAGLNWCKEKTGQFYNLLEKRYGRPTAIACLATGQAAGWATTIAGAVSGVPIVIPGLSILGSLPAVAAAEIYLQLRGKHSEDQPVDMAKVKMLAEAFEKKITAEFAAYIKGHEFAEVPAVRQKTPWTCGPASLLSVCKAYGINTTEEAIRDLAGTTEEGGTNPEQMAAAARALGLIAEPMEPMDFDHLMSCMDRGYPVIACIQAWGTQKEMERDQAGHWVVFTGIDGDKISLMDPAVDDGKCLQLETFSIMKNWHDKDANGVPYDHFGLIIKGKS
jgi:predicted double-glycine peptidase